MIDTLHICGRFPLTVFVESTGIRLARAHRVSVEQIDTALYLTFLDEQPIYGYETHVYEHNLGQLNEVFVRSACTHLVFNKTVFATTARLVIAGCNNTVEFWSCSIVNLCITTSAVSVLDFQQQPLVDSVRATLRSTLVTGLKVIGGQLNNIHARNRSAVELSVGLAEGRPRTFDFCKDDSSKISVLCSARGSRDVVEDRERWFISDGLDSIVNPRAQKVS